MKSDLQLGLEAVDGRRHSSGYSIGQTRSENKRPPCTQTRGLLWELDGHRTTFTHIENLQLHSSPFNHSVAARV